MDNSLNLPDPGKEKRFVLRPQKRAKIHYILLETKTAQIEEDALVKLPVCLVLQCCYEII